MKARTLAVSSINRDAGISSVWVQVVPTQLFSDPATDVQLVQYTIPTITLTSQSVFNIGNSLVNILPARLRNSREYTFGVNLATFPLLTAPLSPMPAITNDDIATAVQDMLNDPITGVAAHFNPILIADFAIIYPTETAPQFTPNSFVVVWDSFVGYTITTTDSIAFLLDFDIPSSMGVLLGFGAIKEIVPTLSHTSNFVPVDLSALVFQEDFVYITSNLIRAVDEGVIAIQGGDITHNDVLFVVQNGTSGIASSIMPPVSIRASPLYQAIIEQQRTGISTDVLVLYILKLASGLAVNATEWSMLMNMVFRS